MVSFKDIKISSYVQRIQATLPISKGYLTFEELCFNKLSMFFLINKALVETIRQGRILHKMCISTNRVSSVMLRLKIFEIGGGLRKKRCEVKARNVMKLIQIQIELCIREMILCFEMNFQNSILDL
jgi:hypothetical protein